MCPCVGLLRHFPPFSEFAGRDMSVEGRWLCSVSMQGHAGSCRVLARGACRRAKCKNSFIIPHSSFLIPHSSLLIYPLSRATDSRLLTLFQLIQGSDGVGQIIGRLTLLLLHHGHDVGLTEADALGFAREVRPQSVEQRANESRGEPMRPSRGPEGE